MAETEAKKQVLKVVRLSDGEVVKSVDVSGHSSVRVEKVMLGMLAKLDTSEYYINDDEAYADE